MIRPTHEFAAVFRKFSAEYLIVLLRQVFHINIRACMVPFVGAVVILFFGFYATAQDKRQKGTEDRENTVAGKVDDSLRLDRKSVV